MTMTDTGTASDASARDALLDTAEKMFSESGFDGVSLRELTRRAGTHLAAVNYHFRSKEKLFEEVILRRIQPLNEQRVAALKVALERARHGRPALADVLEAFARPIVVGVGTTQRNVFGQFLVRLFMESDPLVRPICEKEFVPVGMQFREAMARACPKLKRREVDTGFVFYLGAMVNVLAFARRREAMSHIMGPAPSEEETLQALVQFGVAGFAGLANVPTSATASRL